MTRCRYYGCGEASDGQFRLAPGSDDALDVAYRQALGDPSELCQWHALLVGDQRVVPNRAGGPEPRESDQAGRIESNANADGARQVVA